MKKIYSLLFFLSIAVIALSQTRTWNGGNGNWNDAAKWTPRGVPVSSDILEFNSVSGTISNVPDLAFRGIIITDGDIILNGAGSDTKTLTPGDTNLDDAFVISAGARLTIGNNLNIVLANNAKAVVDGTLIVTISRNYYTNAGETTKTIVNGIIRNEGGSIVSVNSMLEFNDGAMYEHASDNGTIPAAVWSENATCSIEGIITKAPQGLDQVFGNYKWNCPLQTGGAFLGNAIPDHIKGDLIIDKTGIDPSAYLSFPGKMKIDGDFILNAGTCVGKEVNTIIELAGGFIMKAGSLKANAASNAAINIHFKGIEKQVFSKTGGAVKAIRFSILDNAIVDFGESVLDGEADFTLEAGGKLMTAHPAGIALTGATGAIQVTGKRNFSTQADYTYTGAVPQITGNGLPAMVRRLIIENKSGTLTNAGVTLSNAIAITGELILNNGFLQTSADRMLTIFEGGAATALENSFVSGPIQKKGNTDFTFPTGWSGPGGGKIPIGISSMDIKATIQAEYKRASATNKGSTINAPLHHISYCEYWELFPTSGGPTAVITMYRNGYSNCNPVSYVDDFSSVRVARSNGVSWTEIGNAHDSLVDGNGFVASDDAGIKINTKEKYFALGHITTAHDPLPVLFDEVMAYEKNEGVNIEWSNLTERDIAIYFVERSVNGMDYTVIGQYLPKSNRDDEASYLHFDDSPDEGDVFYRIKVIGKNTKIIFSKVMRIQLAITTPQPKLNFYPNPVANKQFVLSLSGMKEGKYIFHVINIAGQEIYQDIIINQGGHTAQTFKLPSSIKPGIYSLAITGSNYHENKMFIVQ